MTKAQPSPDRIARANQHLTMTERAGNHRVSPAVDEAVIRRIVETFYSDARADSRLGPIFEAHVSDWDAHFDTMCDFWSSALLRTGRYAGRPVQAHRPIPGLSADLFRHWQALFRATVQGICSLADALVIAALADRMAGTIAMMLGFVPRKAS